MNDSFGRHTIAVGGEMAVADTRPLGRARAISGLISEEALASERLGRLTDKVAAALLDANLLSILVPRADGGLGGTGVELFEAAEEIARADGSAGWCVAISNVVSGFVHKALPPKPAWRCSDTVPSPAGRHCCPRPIRSRRKAAFAFRATLAGAPAARCHAG